MIVKAIPKFGAGTDSDGMRADPRDTRTVAGAGAEFAGFHEEIDAAFRPG